jgi:hypothetical protein
VVGASEFAGVFVVAGRLLLVGVDLPVSEVADQEVAAEAAEASGSGRQSPGRVDP